MPLTTRVWGAGKVLFLCGALLLTFVLFAAASMRLALKTREVVVPEPIRSQALACIDRMLAFVAANPASIAQPQRGPVPHIGSA